MLPDSLAKLGFSPSEAKVYLHLAKRGASYPNRIAAETGLNRTNVYEALDRLVAKGVVAFLVRNKVKWFEAKPPKQLLSLADQQADDLEVARKELASDISTFKTTKTDALEAQVFVGKKGLRMLMEEILATKRPIALIAAELQLQMLLGPYFELWHKERAELKIRQRSIFPKKFKGKLTPRPLLDYRFVDDRFTNPTTTIIYGDTCLFLQWSKEPLAIRIESKELARSHRNYFEMLWRS